MSVVHLTEFSYGTGCGGKISGQLFDHLKFLTQTDGGQHKIKRSNYSEASVAAYDFGSGDTVLSSTDLFLPVVDDPTDFGRISAAHALSPIYALGGRPLMAVGILGWPLQELTEDQAQQVITGAEQICLKAGAPLVGGHCINSLEPIFGLAITGRVNTTVDKQRGSVGPGSVLLLSKPLGLGILTTALKQKSLPPNYLKTTCDAMCRLNDIGVELGVLPGIEAVVHINEVGLLEPLLGVCERYQLRVEINFSQVPLLEGVDSYCMQGCIPDKTRDNYQHVANKVGVLSARQQQILCDPQVGGGLLIIISPGGVAEALTIAQQKNVELFEIGRFEPLSRAGDYLEII